MSGVGRGRGWLNLNKNNTNRPGIQSPAENDFNSGIIANTAAAPKINPKFANIITNISLYNENDDGILLNSKLKHIIEEYKKSCSTDIEVNEAFANIYDNCLYDGEFAAKTTGMVSTQSFASVDIHGVKIRSLFIMQFQKDFEASKQMQLNNPKAFRNSVKMLSDFFHKARWTNGQPFTFFATPLLKYLNMLLESATEVDLQLFTVLLYMNGNNIKNEHSSELFEVLIQVRSMLSLNDRLSTISRLWLLMSLDISNNRYNFLPVGLHQFYLRQLGDDAMATIKKLNTELSIQTSYQNMQLDSIQSNVQVLQQVNSASDGWEASPPQMSQHEPEKEVVHSTKTYPSKTRDSKSKDGAYNGTWQNWEPAMNEKNEKTPRPILGAGVRLKHNETKGDEGNWRQHKYDGEWKEESSWDNKKKGGHNSKQKKTVSKGWEHDDRFENEYN